MSKGSLLTKRLSGQFDARTARALAALELHTIGDLVYHFPRRYIPRHNLSNLAQGQVGDHLTVVAEVVESSSFRAKNGKIVVKANISDGQSRLELAFFAKNAHHAQFKLTRELAVGTRAMFDGRLGEFRGTRQLVQPRVQLIDPELPLVDGPESGLLPIYPASAKAPSWGIAKAVATVLPALEEGDIIDPLPDGLAAERGWPTALQALLAMHQPRDLEAVEHAKERLRFEEALVLQTALARRRAQSAALPATARPSSEGGLLSAFDAGMPFTLTPGQQAVGREIAADLAREHPMHRLLQGEVGSGKTVVALRAMLTVIDAGGQAAMLAPTEVLAAQHHRGITGLLGNLASAGMLPLAGPVDDGVSATRVALLTGSLGAKAKREAMLAAASGDAGIVIGTHALLQEDVAFADLGLVVVDEQQRFGVEQRDALRAKSLRTPHLLVMTATPIPRTVAMTTFGDLDTSTLRELPTGRQPVTTHVVPEDRPKWPTRMWQLVRAELEAGRQAFVVCPAIDGQPETQPASPDEPRPMTTVVQMMERLADEPALAGRRIGMLHGRMSTDDKDAVMTAFTAGELGVLVGTTVIEVGVDVPNASVMVVMDATRFGVSQLHQLRGRVGRGGHPGYCFFVVPDGTDHPGMELLEQVAATMDGFEVARLDLEQRREGDVLGARQSGAMSSLRVLRVTEHEDVIAEARTLANAVIAEDPELVRHSALQQAIDAVLNPEREVFLERG